MAIRISVELSHICPLEELTAHSAAAEAHGFYRIWVPDTVVSPWEAWMAASTIMHTTTRLHIGVGVTNPYTRHPVIMAQMAATMQNYSGGRLALSLGRGIGPFLDKAGIIQYPQAVEECVLVLRRLLAGERTTFRGRVFWIDAMLLRTRPPTTPVPIFLAAIGPTGWESAMRVGDGVATVWHPQLGETRQRWMAGQRLPSAVLIPFAQTQRDFFTHPLRTLAELQQRVTVLEQWGFDEVIVAYANQDDLHVTAQLLQRS